jgi:hypothetical protein
MGMVGRTRDALFSFAPRYAWRSAFKADCPPGGALFLETATAGSGMVGTSSPPMPALWLSIALAPSATPLLHRTGRLASSRRARADRMNRRRQ